MSSADLPEVPEDLPPGVPAGSPWLAWARKLDAMARIGSTFASNPYETRRYTELAAISKAMLAELWARPEVELPEMYHPTEGYVTPKVDVRAAVFDEENRLLLVREVADGRWSLPGGWADVGDSPASSAEREVREESGFHCRLTHLIGVFDAHDPGSPFSAYKIVFGGDVIGGEAGGDHETDGVGFYTRDQLPPLSHRRTPDRVIEAIFAHRADPTLPALFE
ncbi:NUDIX hydrolase N-terminal domain-containing protein [Sporichthya polymorpha]|uniref:NUDIX hydrolase N-terminal domain-containing protein n=1 Tax=Sporichthya polymorpha TaxID=35751 RepID=UPI0003781886|nr:NUDIX hydrolase N-terminal domain-containing protein [Sporichthya polymorpha]